MVDLNKNIKFIDFGTARDLLDKNITGYKKIY